MATRSHELSLPNIQKRAILIKQEHQQVIGDRFFFFPVYPVPWQTPCVFPPGLHHAEVSRAWVVAGGTICRGAFTQGPGEPGPWQNIFNMSYIYSGFLSHRGTPAIKSMSRWDFPLWTIHFGVSHVWKPPYDLYICHYIYIVIYTYTHTHIYIQYPQ